MKYSDLLVICPFCKEPTAKNQITDIYAYNPFVETAYNAMSTEFCMCEKCKEKLFVKLEKGEI